jgi:acetolactate synthase-1/2/3 large subunit
MRVADYIFKYLADYGIKHVFIVVGGGAMILNDALKKSGIKYICNHHEQACAMAAEGYSRVTNGLAVVCVTSGPGGLNTLTGVMGQWTDSIPVLYLSGQVNYETTIQNTGLRQLGDQEINIIDIVKPITKYAEMVINSISIKDKLQRAIYLATTGRRGPVWLDIPLNVQGANID